MMNGSQDIDIKNNQDIDIHFIDSVIFPIIMNT